jgi:Domain of unknown function (DUF3560)
MNEFEFKRKRRADRYRVLAEKHEYLSNQRHNAARREPEMIPPGQPILVGYHSGKGHRTHLNRIDRHFAKAKEHHDKGRLLSRRAAAIDSNRAIFSDDPDASEKLIDKLERLKKRQGLMKRANQLIRKSGSRGPDRARLCRCSHRQAFHDRLVWPHRFS